MDPASIAGAIVTIAEVIHFVYKFSKDVHESKKEIARLRSELFGLKATFEHMERDSEQMVESRKVRGFEDDDDFSPLLRSEETRLMFNSATSLVQEIGKKLRKVSEGRRGRLRWVIGKSEILEYIQKLERHKSYFVLALTTDDFELSKRIYVDLQSAKLLIEDQYDRQLQQDRLAQQDALRSWLAPYDPWASFQKALSEHHPATGAWFLQGVLPLWIKKGPDQSRPVLWLRGRPGTGKTTLISSAIHNILFTPSERSGVGMAFFFCTFNEPGSAEPRNIVGSYVEQLGRLSPSASRDIESKYLEQLPHISGERLRPSIDILQKIFIDCSRHFKQIYLFLDGPNESNDPSALLTCLLSIVKLAGNIRLILSSTESLSSRMPPWSSSHLDIVEMSSGDLNGDIGRYIESCLREHDRLRCLPPHLKQDIKREFIGNADGSFQFVKCQLQSVLMGKTAKEVRTSLANIPQTLEQTYCNELMAVPEDQKYLVRRVMLWLTFCPTPMTERELYEAILIEEESTTIDEDWRLLHPDEILQSCGKLISHGSNSGYVTLAHSSVRSYMVSPQLLESPASYFWIDSKMGHSLLLRYCLTYLCFDDFRSGYCDSFSDARRRYADWPMLRYSARAFSEFARSVSDFDYCTDSVTRDIIIKLLRSSDKPRGGYFGSFIQAFMTGIKPHIKLSSTLYFAAREGLNSVTKLLLKVDGKRDLEVRGGRRGSTPLHVASAFGNVEVVKTLLEAGADGTEINEKGEAGLQWASQGGHQEIVDLLLQAGADIRRLNETVPIWQPKRTPSIPVESQPISPQVHSERQEAEMLLSHGLSPILHERENGTPHTETESARFDSTTFLAKAAEVPQSESSEPAFLEAHVRASTRTW